MNNYAKIEAMRVALEGVGRWASKLSYAKRSTRELQDFCEEWSTLSPAELIEACEGVVAVLSRGEMRDSEKLRRALSSIEAALELDNFDDFDDLDEITTGDLDDPFVGEVLIVREGCAGWDLIHAKAYDRDGDGFAMRAAVWPRGRQPYLSGPLFEHGERICSLGSIEFSSTSPLCGPTPERVACLVREVTRAKRKIGRDVPVFAAPLSSEPLAYMLEGADDERGDVVWGWSAAPLSAAEILGASPIWRGVAAGQLSSLISEARAEYFEARAGSAYTLATSNNHDAALASAQAEAVENFENLRQMAFATGDLIGPFAEVARLEDFSGSLFDGLLDAGLEWAALRRIEEFCEDVGKGGEDGAAAYRDFERVVARILEESQDEEICTLSERAAYRAHLSRYAYRVADLINAATGGALRKFLSFSGATAAQVEVYDQRRFSPGCHFTATIWSNRTGRYTIKPVCCSSWALTHGDEIQRVSYHFDFLALYALMISEIAKHDLGAGAVQIVDSDGIFWNERPARGFARAELGEVAE